MKKYLITICEYCKRPTPVGAYCVRCRAKINNQGVQRIESIKCPHCKIVVPKMGLYCSNCGYDLPNN